MGLHMTSTGGYGFRDDGDGRGGFGSDGDGRGWVLVSVPVQTSSLRQFRMQSRPPTDLSKTCLDMS